MNDLFLQRVYAVIDSSIDKPDFGVEDLAREMAMSRSSLLRKVKHITGKSPRQLILDYKMKLALDYLRDGDLAVFQVADRLGFRSASYFSTAFHEHFGYPPFEAKKQVINDDLEGHSLPEDKSVNRIARMSKRLRGGQWFYIGILAVVVLSVGILLVPKIVNSKNGRSVAVMPFRMDAGDPHLNSFGLGLREKLLNQLKKQDVIKVISRVSADSRRFDGMINTNIGKELNADYLVKGNISREGDLLRLDLELIETKSNVLCLPLNRLRHWEDSYELQDELAVDLAKTISEAFKGTKDKAPITEVNANTQASLFKSQGDQFINYRNLDPQKALRCYKKAIEADSLYAKGFLGVSCAISLLFSDVENRRDSMLVEAGSAIEKAFELNPALPEAHQKKGFYYYQTGKYEEALEEFRIALDVQPDDPETLYEMALAYLSLGKREKAIDHLNRFLEIDPNSVPHLSLLGEIYASTGDFELSSNYYNRVLTYYPESSQAYLGLCSNQLKADGDTRKARKILSRMERGSVLSDSAGYYFQLARMEWYEGHYQDAIEILSKWEGRIPLGPPYYCHPVQLQKAITYGLMNEIGLARSYFDSTRIWVENLQRCSVANRNDPRVAVVLGIAFAGLGQLSKAREWAETTVRLSDDFPNAVNKPYVLEDEAYLYTKIGEPAKALEIIKELLSTPGPINSRLIEIDPRWDPLRELTGYREIMQKF